MKAIVQDRYGPPEVLRVGEVDQPVPGPGQVLVRVHAAGVDRGVWHLVTGLPLLVRLLGFGLRRPRQPVPGLDLAGTVEAVGAGVTGFAPGDEVFGIGTGTYAELALAPAGKLAPKPAGLGFAAAAAVPVSATTALQAVRDHARVGPGQRVLVLGASGGVGSFAVQLAKLAGAEVTGVCSAAKADLVRSLGADAVLDHAVDDVTAGRYDAILDAGGVLPLRRLRRALTPTGTLVLIGGENGGRLTGGFQRQLRAVAWSPLTKRKMRVFVASENAADLVELTGPLAAGTLRAAVDRTYPLVAAPDAVRRLADGQVRGKLVVTVP